MSTSLSVDDLERMVRSASRLGQFERPAAHWDEAMARLSVASDLAEELSGRWVRARQLGREARREIRRIIVQRWAVANDPRAHIAYVASLSSHRWLRAEPRTFAVVYATTNRPDTIVRVDDRGRVRVIEQRWRRTRRRDNETASLSLR